MKAHALIDWDGLRARLAGLNKCEASRMGGQEVIDPLVMFKAVLLGQWHNLSDSKLEEALRVRIDFMHFCGMDLSDEAPDETTLCRFRNRLIASGRLAGLLAGVNSALQTHGLSVKCAQGAIIDVTLVWTAVRPRRDRAIELDATGAPKFHEDGTMPCSMATTSPKWANCTGTRSADPDATWVRKGKKNHSGYNL
jgi:IS5 family transposase